MAVDVTGNDLPPVLHEHRGGERLPSRCGAHVQHPVPGLHSRRQRSRPGGGVLDLEPALLKGGHGLQASPSGQQPAVRQPGVRRQGRLVRRQARGQLVRAAPQGIALYDGGRRLVIQPEVLLCLPVPKQLHQPPNQPLRVAVPQGQIPCPVPVGNLRQTLLLTAQPPEDGVDQAGGPLPLLPLHQLHALVHGGAIRNPVHIQNLVSPQPEHIPDKGLQRVKCLGAAGVQVKIQQRTVLQHAVGQPGRQRRLPPVQIPAGRFQMIVRPGVQPPAGGQRLQGRLPAPGHQRRPLSFRPAKISRYRSSCSRLISSAAT